MQTQKVAVHQDSLAHNSRSTLPHAVRVRFSLFAASVLLLSLVLVTTGIPGTSGKQALLASSAVKQIMVPSGFVYPVMGPRKSSSYGFRVHPIRRFTHNHKGIDLAAPIGAPIRSVASGIVVFADPYKGYGKLIVVKHNDHLTSHYGHCAQIKAVPGQRVKAGQIIGYIGDTGMATGPHLHFEMRIDGSPENPERFIPGLASDALG